MNSPPAHVTLAWQPFQNLVPSAYKYSGIQYNIFAVRCVILTVYSSWPLSFKRVQINMLVQSTLRMRLCFWRILLVYRKHKLYKIVSRLLEPRSAILFASFEINGPVMSSKSWLAIFNNPPGDEGRDSPSLMVIITTHIVNMFITTIHCFWMVQNGAAALTSFELFLIIASEVNMI